MKPGSLFQWNYFLITPLAEGRTDYLHCLLAYQSTCWTVDPESTCTCYAFQSPCWHPCSSHPSLILSLSSSCAPSPSYSLLHIALQLCLCTFPSAFLSQSVLCAFFPPLLWFFISFYCLALTLPPLTSVMAEFSLLPMFTLLILSLPWALPDVLTIKST